jgi:RNA polymerase sigma-70 factor (ECF subfamily)
MPALTQADRSRLAAAQAGDVEAFFELVQPHQRMLFVSAVAVVRNDADAEEVVQEAMLKALRYLGGFRGECKFSTWLVQIVVNEARMRLRKERRHLYESLDEDVETAEGDYIPREWADWREIPSESLQRKELREALKAACDSLPPRYREVFLLRDVEQLNIVETAQILGITSGCVRTRLLRARLMMRDMLAHFRRD